MATRESPVRHPPSRIPPNPLLRLSYNPSPLISEQQGYAAEELKNLPSAGEIDRVDAANVLEKGRILYYYRLATGKLNKTKYGLCFLLKDKFEWFQMVSFIKPRKLKTILNYDRHYFFYSDLTLIDIPQRVHYVSAIQAITEENVEYLLPFLLIKDWKYHSNDTPFISLEAFLHHIMSISANIFMIKRLSSLENIDWGFVDNKGNSFIHAACELKRYYIDLAKTIIGNAINKNQLLMNIPNVENLTPLRLCLDKMNQMTPGDYSCFNFVEYLIEKGANLIIHKNDSESMAVTNQFFISCLQVENHGENELIIVYEFPKIGSFRSNTYLYSKLNKLDHCQITRTNKLQKKPDMLANILKEQFDLVLLTNCPQIIEYIFNPDNELLSKSDRVTKHKDTMVHLTVRYANPVILQYILSGYECWDATNEFGDNLLHTFIEKYNSSNIKGKELMSNTPRDHLNQLAFENRDRECLTCLVLETPIDILSAENNAGCTPLQLAVIYSFVPAVELLLENSITNLNSRDNSGCNVLYNSIIHYNEVIFKMVLSAVLKFDDIYHFEDKLIDTCIHQEPPLTPFLLSIQLNKLDATKLLVSNGARIANPCSLLKYSKELDDLKRLFMIKVDGRNIPVLIRPTEIQNLQFNRSHILEFFYMKGEFKDFQKCVEALPVTKIIEQNTELNTILHFAIENPFEEKLNFLLDQISDLAQSDERALQLINAINGKGETALYLAVKSSNHALAKRILGIGASIDTLYAIGNNILHVSICLGDQTMIEFLLSELKITKLFCKPNKEGKTPVQMLTKNGFISQALSVIEKVSQNGEIHNLKINGCHILEYFYMKGELEHFQRCFLALPVTKIIEQNTEFNTILHLTIENPVEEKLNFLLDQISALVQSDERALQLLNAINGKGETALHLAVKKSCHALTMLILDIGANIEILYANEDNILHVSIDFGDQVMINILLTRPEIAKLFCRPNKDGNTPIHLLIRNGHIDEALVAIERIRPENLDDGRLLLMLAELDDQIVQNAIFNRLPIDSLLKVENIRREILHYAINLRSIFSIKILIQHNIDITVKNSSGKTALHFAIDLRDDQIWSLLFEYLITFNEHTQHEIVDIPHLKDPNLFQYSIMENYFPAVKDLFKLRPNIFITHHANEDTIIHLATKLLDCVPILDHLLNQINREDVEALLQSTNSLDLTPLHYAVHCGNTEALKLFQQFNLKIAVPSDGNLFFFNKVFSDKLVLCKHFQNRPNSTQKTILFGYKINSPEETIYILTDIPHLKQCKLYQQAEVEVVHRVNEEYLSILLQVPNTDFFQILISKQIIKLENSFSNESTLLHQAARHSSCPVVNYFLNYKGSDRQLSRRMDLFALDNIGNSILYYAIQNSNEEKLNEFLSSILTKILERLRANPQFPNILNKENANSKRILEVCFDLNKFDAFKCMLDPTFQMELTYEDSDGCTLLHKIVKGRGDERFLEALLDEIKRRILLESFEKYLNHPTRDIQQTALHLCILKNQTTLLNLISKYSPNFSCKDKVGNTALHLATNLKLDNEHPATNTLIQSFIGYILNLEGDTISLLNAVNNQCLAPIHFAIMNGNIHISSILLSKGANLYAVDNDRKSVLHYAIENENKDESEKVIKFLLDYERTHPNPGNDLLQMQDKQGNTPLHSAVTLLKSNLIKILQNRSPNLAISNNSKKTVLHLAIYDNCQEIVALILEYFATTKQNQLINMQDDQGNSPLHIAIKYESCYSLKKLLSANAALDLRDNSGQTPLHLAILKGEEVFRHIFATIGEKIQLSPDNYHYLTIVNNEGLSPLHHALMNATNMSYIEKLINIGAKLSYTDKMGSITMCAGKGGLDLCLLKQVKYGSRFQLLNHFSEGWIGVNWFVGFKVKHFPLWVVTKLLELEEIEIMEEQNVTEVTQFRFEDEILVNLIKCESIDPIRVAIVKNLFPHETIKNGKKLLNFVQDKDGSAPVKKFVINSFRPVEEICFWIKTSVFDLKEMNFIFKSLSNLNLTLIMPDSSKLRGEELKRNEISIALSNALLYSLDNDSIEYFNFLLSHNLCLNAQYGVEKDSLLHAMIKKEKSNEFLALFLNTVCEYETKSKGKILINGEPLIDARNAESLTPLALCVINKQERILNFLLTHKPSLTVLGESGNSILHYVATAGDKAITEIIFSKILNSPDNVPNLFNMPNSDGCIPLHLAVEKGNVKLSEMFLNNGSKFYSQDFTKRTILHHAIENPDQTLHSSMIEFILTYEQNNEASLGRRIYEIGDVDNSIPLNYAIERSSLIAVKLLAPYPSTLNRRNSNNQTALHLVSMKRDNDIFDEVFYHISNQERNRDALDCIACCKDKQGLIALDVCIKQQNEHAKRKLLGYTLCLNLSTCQWNPNLNQAFIVETYFEIKKTLNEVITHNSELILQVHLYYLKNKNNVICFQDDIKLTTMYSAIYHNYSHAFESLLKTSSFVNILDDNGEA